MAKEAVSDWVLTIDLSVVVEKDEAVADLFIGLPVY